MHPVRTRLAAALLAGLPILLPTAPARADPAAAITAVGGVVAGTVGGPRLATTGTVSSPGVRALPPGVVAAGFVVADLNSGAVYAARNPHLHTLPASCLKTLTALVLLPKLDPRRIVVASQADANVDGTRVGIVRGGKYTVDQLFQALLMVSGNDAAELLARTGGSRAQTLEEMNATAARLRADDTHAVTPSGLDGPGQSTSAYDLALINRATMKLPSFRHYVGMRRSTFGAQSGLHFVIENRNRLLRNGYPGALGIKDGFTDAAQHTFIGAATRRGHTYLVTLVRTDRTYWQQAAALLDWAFALPPDATPVGRLVDPLPSTEGTKTKPAAGAARPPLAATAATSSGSSAIALRWQILALLVSLAVMAGVLLRRHRRSWLDRRRPASPAPPQG